MEKGEKEKKTTEEPVENIRPILKKHNELDVEKTEEKSDEKGNQPETPEVQYKENKKNRTKKLVIWLISIGLIEGCAGLCFYHISNSNQIDKRVINSYENQMIGKVFTIHGTYQGKLNFGLFTGQGRFKYKNGTTYAGKFSNNKFSGLGKLEIPDKGTYSGMFQNGVKQGNGKFIWNNGDSYTGEWLNDKMNGQGVYITAENAKYEGVFDKNRFASGECDFENQTGTYKLTFKNHKIDEADIRYSDGTSYSGDCSQKGITGVGMMNFNNGDSYTGDFENDKRSGKGQYIWSSGAKYDGDWINDEMNGTGVYTYASGDKASGSFEKNIFINGSYSMKNAFGSYTFQISDGVPSSVKMNLKDGTKYSGNMSNGKLNGKAQIKYANGDKYSGAVSNGQKSGEGNYKWKNGASYVGGWSKDKMDGSGTYTYPKKQSGYMIEGSFKNGHPDGTCTYYASAYKKYNTEWKKGKCVKVYSYYE